MSSLIGWILLVAGAIVAAAVVVLKKIPRGPAIPEGLLAGKPLPTFSAIDEAGNAVESSSLIGQPAVILFVRGNWCPFCTKQVEKLTENYKAITKTGAKLIFVTPKPLETTRRVAEFFKVEFDFWMDESLAVSRDFGLVQSHGVPAEYKEEYGEDTVWPTAVITDKDGVIRYSKLARYIFDRPDPALLLKELQKL